MKTLRAMIARAKDEQSGLTLIEVLIAVAIFSIIATGVAFTVVSVLNVTQQSQHREEAANLAAQDLDLSRSIDNVFDLLSDTYTTTVGGTAYTITRTVEWVTDASATARCGTGGGNLQYKRVNVTVGWAGMKASTAPVHADTLINPASRINDPADGTILVSVINASGSGTPNITVTAAPSSTPNGAIALASTPDPTDAQGCTYVLEVAPGNYDVKISKSGYLDVNQASTVTKTISVVASSATSVSYQYDQAGSFTVTYPALTAIPLNLDTSWISTYGIYTTTPTNYPPGTQALYPFPSGYQVIAGDYDDPALPDHGCASVDPSQWAAGKSLNGDNVSAGVRQNAVAANPGQTGVAAPVTMERFTISGVTTGQYVTAVQVAGDAASGDPGCATMYLSTYNFAKASLLPSLTTYALPYGTWKIYTGSSSGALTTRVPITSLSIVAPGNGGTELTNGGTITLDPRADS